MAAGRAVVPNTCWVGRSKLTTRRYSDDDLVLLGRIGALVADGVNLTASPTFWPYKPSTPL